MSLAIAFRGIAASREQRLRLRKHVTFVRVFDAVRSPPSPHRRRHGRSWQRSACPPAESRAEDLSPCWPWMPGGRWRGCLHAVRRPGTDVIGVAHVRLDAERRAAERRRDLGDQLLESIRLGPEGAREVAIQTVSRSARVGTFVKYGPTPIDRLEESPGRRHLYMVERCLVNSAIAADGKIDPTGLDERFDIRCDQGRFR